MLQDIFVEFFKIGGPNCRANDITYNSYKDDESGIADSFNLHNINFNSSN